MQKFFAMLVCVLMLSASAFAQSAMVRVTKIDQYRALASTNTGAAIPSTNVGTGVYSWKICNDAVNTSTHLLVGQAADVSTDGTMLGLGQCFECVNCTNALLKAMKVEGQAVSNGYSVIQYRQ